MDFKKLNDTAKRIQQLDGMGIHPLWAIRMVVMVEHILANGLNRQWGTVLRNCNRKPSKRIPIPAHDMRFIYDVAGYMRKYPTNANRVDATEYCACLGN